MGTVGVVSGTGPAGRGVALRLAAGGSDVVIGSRDLTRAASAAASLNVSGAGTLRGGSNEEAADCALVVLATPYDAVLDTARALAPALAGKTVISMVNGLAREGTGLVPKYPARGSMAAELSAALPRSAIVGAFHHLPAKEMLDLASGLDADVIIVADDEAAAEAVAALVDTMPGLRAVVAGPLALAGAVEAFTAVCVSINVRHHAHSYVKLAGLVR